MEGVCKRLAHIRAVRVGYHVSTGGKYYRDRHLEHASAEAADPIEACAQILGGDQLLAEVIGDRKFGGGGIDMRDLDVNRGARA